MIKHQVYAFFAATLLVAAAWGGPPQRGEPGSLLLFPEYESSPGIVTLVTVTNIEDSFTTGGVNIRWEYVDGTSCSEFNRTDSLTPNDTLTVVAGVHNPTGGAGYLYVYAVDPATGDPTLHNYLIGHATILNGLTAGSHSVEPRTYEGIAPELDTDGRRSLDGIEYEQAADEILVPRFYGQGAGFDSYLVLVDLTGGANAVTTLNLLIYNDNEDVFSTQLNFNCWARVPLTDISGIFANDFLQLVTNHDAAEIVGMNTQEAGWMRIDGYTSATDFVTVTDPAIVVMLVDRSKSGTSASPLGQLGLQDNGSMTPDLPNFPDCNGNGISDLDEIANGTTPDCNGNNIPDECEGLDDCNSNGIPDECENLADCNLNGIPDECEDFPDCNGNGIPDECDPDADGDGIPDDCDLECDNSVVVELWPPNHKEHDVDLAALIDALPHSNLSATIAITSITQDEPLDAGGGGPGAADCDGDGVGSSVATIRAERMGNGNGRVYVVGFTATGPFGQTCAGTVLVTVPHSQKGQAAVDDGQLYDSTQNCP